MNYICFYTNIRNTTLKLISIFNFIKNCQKFSENLSKIVKNCQNLSKIVKICQISSDI